MRFEHLRFIGIDTDLHHQYPVGRSPFVLASKSRTPPVAMFLLSVVTVSVSRRYPPNVVIHKGTAAARANIGQNVTHLPVDWCDDPPQEVRAFFLGFPAHCSGGRCHPLPPSHTLPESLRRSIRSAFLPSCILPRNSPNCHASLRCKHGALSGDRNLYPHFF